MWQKFTTYCIYPNKSPTHNHIKKEGSSIIHSKSQYSMFVVSVKYVAVYQRWWQFEIQYSRKFLFTDFYGKKARVLTTQIEWKDEERKPKRKHKGMVGGGGS
jgi:hypothetical protein